MKRPYKIAIAVAGILATPSAFAWDCNYWSQSSDPKAECYKPAQPASPQHQAQHQAQTQAQRASARSTSNSVAASQSGVQTDSHDVTSIPRETPMAVSGNVQPTASCRNARNGGASSPIAGISFGFSTKDDECDARETARMLFQMGQTDMAVAVLCKTKSMKDLPQCSSPKPEYPPGERERRMIQHGFPVDK